MTNTASLPTAIPPDDPRRLLAIADPDDRKTAHVSVGGSTYTILLSGKDTDGRYCLIDMNVPPGCGPPPHRHDFEEMFTLLDGEIEFTFRGETSTLRAGASVNIPANAPHFFRNKSGNVARMLCVCAPAGQEDFFLHVGDAVAHRTAPPPGLTDEQQNERRRLAEELAPKYRTELMAP